ISTAPGTPTTRARAGFSAAFCFTRQRPVQKDRSVARDGLVPNRDVVEVDGVGLRTVQRPAETYLRWVLRKCAGSTLVMPPIGCRIHRKLLTHVQFGSVVHEIELTSQALPFIGHRRHTAGAFR